MALRDLLPGKRVRMHDATSVGVVSLNYAFFDKPLQLRSGARLERFHLAYETYGTLNDKADNAILICHALSGDAHVAGYYTDDPIEQPGWWDSAVGPGKMFDTNQYIIICSNVLGGCRGSTGPGSPHPEDHKAYAMRFPVVTIADMVQAQTHLMDELGIETLFAVAGGSMGGMQALQWAVDYPQRVRNLLFIASTPRASAQQIGFNEIGRQAIYADPYWNHGNYYGQPRYPDAGLAVARMVGHITYMSEQSLEAKFDRRLQHSDDFGYHFQTDFAVESYLRYQGHKFTKRFDANSYLYITKALDYYDVGQGYGGMTNALSRISADILAMSFSSDWLYTKRDADLFLHHLAQAGNNADYHHVQADFGHDSFLVETETMHDIVGGFLTRQWQTHQAAITPRSNVQ